MRNYDVAHEPGTDWQCEACTNLCFCTATFRCINCAITDAATDVIETMERVANAKPVV